MTPAAILSALVSAGLAFYFFRRFSNWLSRAIAFFGVVGLGWVAAAIFVSAMPAPTDGFMEAIERQLDIMFWASFAGAVLGASLSLILKSRQPKK